MKTVSFDEIGSVVATFLCSEEVQCGEVVGMSGNDAVEACYAGQPPCGLVLSLSGDGYAAVQLKGAAAVKYSGTGVAVGWKTLCADGSGGLRVPTSSEVGRQYLVLSVDTAGKTAVVLL